MAKTVRLEIRADDRFLEALSKLSNRTNKSRANVIRDALNYYEKALNEWEKENPEKLEAQNNPTMGNGDCV
jgi:predicted transcriptional regulator